jgi:hypothetical protein
MLFAFILIYIFEIMNYKIVRYIHVYFYVSSFKIVPLNAGLYLKKQYCVCMYPS